MYAFKANFTGIDISEQQIVYAKKLAQSQHMNITFQCISAEDCMFDDQSFDVITAVQCFPYFHHE